MERGKLKNNLRLKMYLRHIFKRYYQYRSTKLFRKWRAVRQNSLKWLSFYKTFEGSLHRFLRNVRLLPSSIEAKGAIETGLITVNGTVCVNPWYVVRSGDIVMLNSEAYRSIMARRISKLISECLPSDLPSVSRKRLLLAMALKKIRRGYAKGLATIATRLAEQEALEQLIGLFGEDKNYAKIKKKKLAAGGPRIGKDDIYVSDVSEFGLRLKEVYGGNRARLKQRLSNLQKFLDDSRAENGKFYYRFQNAVYVIRAPNSCRELFSVSKQERRPFYNPRTINFFLSHRFWH
jgi:ribosomal protein S4